MKKLLAVFFALIFLLAGCSSEQPVQVTTQEILLSDGTLTLTHEGTITLSDESEIRSPVSGSLVEKYIEDGTDVAEGQLLFKVSEFESHADLLQLKAELAKAQTDLARALAINDPAVVDLQIELEKIQSDVQNLQWLAEAGMIYAPKSGRLGAVEAPLGLLVTADETLLATIGYPNPLAVRFEVSGEEARLLSVADALKVTLILDDGKGYPTEGAIRILDGSTAEATFDNSDGLLFLGMNVKVELTGLTLVNALLVPASAIQERDGNTFVFVDSNKKAALKNISLGDKLGTYYIVKDGLKAGERVIVDGMTNLREGTPLFVEN